MTEPQHEENVDTGALTDDAVPSYEEPASYEEQAPVSEPYQEAPGSPSSEAKENPSTEESDGSAGSDSSLPHGAEIMSHEDAEKNTVAGNPPGDPTL